MTTFNTLLLAAGIKPDGVKLLRHQVKSLPGRPTPFHLWRCQDPGFELYQRIQKRPIFQGASVVASFVVAPRGETMFVGLFEVGKCNVVPAGTMDPISGKDVGGLLLYDLGAMTELDDCRGRLVVDWGSAYRAWMQRAAQNDKRVTEFRSRIEDPAFPGLLSFRRRLSELASVPPSWREVLSAVSGVYLLVCPRTGRQYVGSANGALGFWGRWMEYVDTGHGGNRRMVDIPKSDYHVSVLEVASSSLRPDELIVLENRWKEKLGSREFGLNAN